MVSTDLFTLIKMKIQGLSELKSLQKVLGATEAQARQTSSALNRMTTQTSAAASSANDAGGQFGKMFNLGMNLMFVGLALQQVFGGLAREMLSMTGASTAFAAGLKSALLPVFVAITPLFVQLGNALANMSRPLKLLVGSLVALLAVLGPVLFFGSQLFLLAQALSISLGSMLLTLGGLLLVFTTLAMAVFFLMRAFKGINPVISALAAIVAGTLLAVLSPVVGVVVALLGVFAGLMGIFKKFGDVIGTVASIIVAAIGVLLAVFFSIPIGIGVVVAAAVALFLNFKDSIIKTLKNIGRRIGKFISGVVNFFANLGRKLGNLMSKIKIIIVKAIAEFVKAGISKVRGLIEFITSLPGKIINGLTGLASTMMQVGKDIVNGIIDGLQAIGHRIADVFMDLLPDPLAEAIGAVGSGVGNLIQGVQNVLTPNDFILTGDGKMIQPAADDTIIGFNGNGPIQPGGGGGDVTVNINDPVMKEDVDVQQVVDEVEDRVNRDARGRTGGL